MRGRTVFTQELIDRSWADALALWDANVQLSPPEPFRSADNKAKSADPLAYIDLENRQVVVNFDQLELFGAANSLTGVLAHEIGHHIRFPHTLSLAAELSLMEQRLLPGLQSSLTNLFFDLQVNEYVGRTRASELIAVYQGSLRADPELSTLFGFYLAIYEELWTQPPGTMVPAALERGFEKSHPGFRRDARMFAQTFYGLPDTYFQFVYFCGRIARYLPPPGKPFGKPLPMSSDLPQPSAEDIDSALQRAGVGQDAIDAGREKGWLDGMATTPGGDSIASLGKLLAGLPGSTAAKFRQLLVERQYRRIVDRYLITLHAVTPPPDCYLPTITEDWEVGDDSRSIDWTASVLLGGALAPLHPLKRQLEPDDVPATVAEFPSVEIYLDTSGSMPHPEQALNAMTLAAQILVSSALRKKGRVRGIIYSSGTPLCSPWMIDEETARRFFLNYSGGGTEFPFALLKLNAEAEPGVVRVVVSDSDFFHNLGTWKRAGMDALLVAAERSRPLVCFLNVAGEPDQKLFGPVWSHPRFRYVEAGTGQLADAAARLARALFGD